MDASNESLILKIRGISDRIPKIVEDAGNMLAWNVKANLRAGLKDKHEYPFVLKNSFEKPGVIKYIPSESVVVVDHVAAKRLEYGIKGELVITPKEGEFLYFKGKDGEMVAVKEVVIKHPGDPMFYAGMAIKQTHKQIAKKFKEIISG